jgi:glycosyltransferase 2 family protein
MKKLLVTLLKMALSLAILAYLVWKSTRGDTFVDLCNQPKQWDMLAAAFGCCSAAVLVTFIRWWYLVKALGIPLGFGDAMRIGFWGYLFNLAPLGIVGGDVVKTVMLAHEQPSFRAKGLASVIFDRVVGLYLLFVVASASLLCTGLWATQDPTLSRICKATFIITVVGTVGLIVVLGPDLTEGRVIRAFGRIPRIGPPLERVILAIRMYSSKPMVLILSSLMSIGVHSLFACGCYFIARGLPGDSLSFGMYFVVMPLSSAASVVPLPMGPLEWVLTTLYTLVPSEVTMDVGQGVVVALTYRLITFLIALLGIPYYFSNRKEMAEVMHEAEVERETDQVELERQG